MSSAGQTLGRVIAALRSGGWQGNAFDLADALWLARQGILSGYRPLSATPPPPPPPPPPKPPVLTKPTGPDGTSTDATKKEPDPTSTEPLTTPTPGPAREAALAVPRSTQIAGSGNLGARSAGVSFLTPAARALPGGRDLLRVLRPLRRRIPDPATWTLDEAATLERFCEQQAWIPVLRPGRRRWLDLAFVIDAGPSMLPWRQTLRELRVLLERSGAFCDVRTWHLDTSAPRPVLCSRPGGRPQDPRELLDPSGRRLVVVVSDAVSPAWTHAQLSHWLERWGRQLPVALVQLFPEAFWDTTALADGQLCRAATRSPGSPNARLRSREWREQSLDAGEFPVTKSPVPLLTLTPESLGPWAQLMAGRTQVRPVAIRPALRGGADVSDPAGEVAATTAPTAEERLEWFRARASRTALKLLQALAAAPLRLPVMRIVQEATVPEARLTHLAEVFVSGLLRRISPPEVTDPDWIDFEFHEGVVNALLSRNRVAEVLRVQDLVSDYLARRFGQQLHFQALLQAGGDAAADAVRLGPENGVFARVAAHLLERFGPRYESVVSQLRSGGSPTPPRPDSKSKTTDAKARPSLAGQEVIYLGSSKEDFDRLDAAVRSAGGTTFAVHREPSQVSDERLAAAAAWVVNFVTTGAWDTAFRVIDRLHSRGILRPFALLSSDARRDALAPTLLEKGAVVATGDAEDAASKLAEAVAHPESLDRRLLAKGRSEAVLRHPQFPAVNESTAHGLFEGTESEAWAQLAGHLTKRSVRPQEVAAWLATATGANAVEYYQGGSEGSSWDFTVDASGDKVPSRIAARSVELQQTAESAEPWMPSGSWDSSTSTSTSTSARGGPLSELYLPWINPTRGRVGGIFYLVREAPAGFHARDLPWLQALLRAAAPTLSQLHESPPSVFKDRNLLWVDDQPERLRAYVDSLRALGAVVHLAKDTLSALQTLADQPVDAIISDVIRMGERRAGLQLLQRLQTEGITLPIAIHTTSRIGTDRRREIEERGAIVCTPNFDEVRRALETALSARPKSTHPPLAARPAREQPNKAPAAAKTSHLSGRRILWVDDKPDKITGLMNRLREAGVELVTCLSSDEAHKWIASRQFDGILSDLGRPEGRWAGFDLLDDLRRADNFTPVIFFTTVGLASSMAKVAKRKGATVITAQFDEVQKALEQIAPTPPTQREFLSKEHTHAVLKVLHELRVEREVQNMVLDGQGEALWWRAATRPNLAMEPWETLGRLVEAATMPAEFLVVARPGGIEGIRAETSKSSGKLREDGALEVRSRIFASQRTKVWQDLSESTARRDANGLSGARLLIPFHAGIIDVWTAEVHGFYARQIRWLEALAKSFPREQPSTPATA